MKPTIWLSNGIDKIKRDSSIPKKIQKERTVYLPKGGSDSVQLSIYTKAEISNISLKPHISNKDIKCEILREGIIEMAEHYPDPIYPQQDNISLCSGTTAFLFRFTCSRNSNPGQTFSEISVLLNGEEIDRVKINTVIWNFALPETPYCATAIALYRSCMKNKHECSWDKAQDLYIKYYDMLKEYRISAYELPYDILDERADSYMSDKNITSFKVPYSDNDELIKKYYEKLSKNEEWIKKAYFYPIDEPKCIEHIDALKAVSNRLKNLFPGARLCVPFFLNIKYTETEDQVDGMTGSVNLWCPKSYMYNDTALYDCNQRAKYRPFYDRITQRQQFGDEVWWYVCWEPGNPYCNLFINQEGIQHRLLFWQQKLYNVHGFLYWGANEWNGVKDPWEDMATVKDLSPDVYGDGSLLYNGNKVGIDGPVASLRLENIRAGIDDFDLLNLAENMFGHDYTIDKIKKLTSNVIEYTMDSELLLNIRNSIGNDISSNM